MSYGVRNTLILLFAFAVIAGGGFGYIYFIQWSTIGDLEAEREEKTGEYEEMSVIAQRYPETESNVRRAEDFIVSYSKTLLPTNDPDQIYRFLTELTGWPEFDFNFTFNDSTVQEEYGIVRSGISGVGTYRAIYDFINRIENSRPVQKVTSLQISPVHSPGEYGSANFSFELSSYYDRTDHTESLREGVQAAYRIPGRFHNPFFPLIRDVLPNENQLVDVENSRLVGLGRSRIFLKDQTGQLVNLSLNDEVYLGRLREIHLREGKVRFVLNKGGIIEEVTLEVQR